VYLSNTDDADHPLKVRIGSVGVAAWDEGLLGACPGQTRRVTADPDKAYGAAGVDGVVPPNATVVFEVKVAAIQNPDLVKSFLDRITGGSFGR
jgi:FKBP-type peptidyl-prolyl cis-trans isomerase